MTLAICLWPFCLVARLIGVKAVMREMGASNHPAFKNCQGIHSVICISSGPKPDGGVPMWRSVEGFETDEWKTPRCPVSWRTERTWHRLASFSERRRIVCQTYSALGYRAESSIPDAEYYFDKIWHLPNHVNVTLESNI